MMSLCYDYYYFCCCYYYFCNFYYYYYYYYYYYTTEMKIKISVKVTYIGLYYNSTLQATADKYQSMYNNA